MKRHTLPGTDLSVSTFSCGLGDLFANSPKESDALLDAYVEAGGNFFDTAHMYSCWLPGGNGLSEISIGDYVRRRGLKDAVIATKGGGPASWRYRKVDYYLSPARVGADIDDSLARLECETLSLYYLHRDDERVPVGEVMDMLHAEIEAGRIRHIAASNWSTARLAAANDYARAKGIPTFALSQPRWSLAAHKNSPGLNAPGEIAWHRQTGLPVAPYSPTARGLFASAEFFTEGDYALPENEQRWNRARELATKRGISPSQIALAYLLCHPFPVFPILGTKNNDRLKEALQAEGIPLSETEMAWLDQG
jgi:aryl-alcohol dehydrogenase-like predicted oxidoreductase